MGDVLVVPSRALEDCGVREGFTALDPGRLRGLLESADWRDRAEAEADETARQVIPYVTVSLGGPGSWSSLAYWRSAAGGERRLRGKQSIGFGGHVEPTDDLRRDGETTYQMVLNAACRELDEELGLGEVRPLDLDLLGVIRDDSDAVGRVHLGVAFACALAIVRVDLKFGPEVHAADWVPPADLREDDLENWSRILRRAIVDAR